MNVLPEKIGPYVVLAPLGAGTMGTVYRAQHEDTKSIVAIKTVGEFSETLIPRIRREIYALSRLQHPGIVAILDQGEEAGRPWYAMSLVQGVNLRDYCRFGDFNMDRDATSPGFRDPQVREDQIRRILTLIKRLCEPLAHLHGEGIIHRDLKPENVIVQKGGIPVLVDFGLSSQFTLNRRESFSMDGGISGTALYMSPEMLRSEPLDARSDLYALGCILYEMIAGVPPFRGKTTIDTIVAHLEGKARPLLELVSGIHPDLDALVKGLLALLPRERIGYADHVASMLVRLGADEPSVFGDYRPRPYIYRPDIMGRATEMDRLQELLENEQSGHGGMLFVGGESGVGKTRLVVEFAKRAQAQDVLVLQGQCTVSGSRSLEAFQDVFQWVADYCRARGEQETHRIVGERVAVLSQYFPSLENLNPKLENPTVLSGAEGLIRLQTCIAQTLFALSQRRSVLLILEDLQWVDELSVHVLQYLLRSSQLAANRLCIVGTYRTEEVREDLKSLIHQVQPLHLRRLHAAEITSMIGEMLALDAPPAELSASLIDLSDGNPFFVAEFLHTAVEQGVLSRNKNCVWEVGSIQPGEELRLSDSLRTLLIRRLQSFPLHSIQLLQACCVVGRETPANVSQAVSELTSEDWLKAVSDLVLRRILEESTGESLRFAHDKIREIGYEQIPELQRKDLHRKTAEILEKLPSSSEDSATLADHWTRAGFATQAARYHLAAARRGSSRFSLKEAKRHYRDYLTIADESDLQTSYIRTEFAREVLCSLGSNRDAIEELKRVVSVAESHRDSYLLALALLGIANAENQLGSFEESERSAIRAQKLLGDQHPAEMGEALRVQAINHWHHGNIEGARSLYEQVLQIQRNINNRIEQAKTISNLATLCWSQGDHLQSRALFEEAIQLHRELGQRRAEGISLNNLAVTYHLDGPFENARMLHEQALDIHRKIGERRMEGVSLSNLGYVSYRSGDIQLAELHLREGLAIQREVGDRLSQAQTLCMLGHLVRVCKGSMDEASPIIHEAETIARGIDARIDLAALLCEEGHLALSSAQDGRPALKEARKLALDAGVGLNSEQGRAIETLGRAVQAFEAGLPLFRGVRFQDIPAPVREWLRATGQCN